MVVATFGPSAGEYFAGKQVQFEEGLFSVNGVGNLDLRQLLQYDTQGHLLWVSPDMRAWARSLGAPAPAAESSPSATNGGQRERASWQTLWLRMGLALGGSAFAALSLLILPAFSVAGTPLTVLRASEMLTRLGYPSPIIQAWWIAVLAAVATCVSVFRIPKSGQSAVIAGAGASLSMVVWSLSVIAWASNEGVPLSASPFLAAIGFAVSAWGVIALRPRTVKPL